MLLFNWVPKLIFSSLGSPHEMKCDVGSKASLLQFLLSSLQCYCGLRKNARVKSDEIVIYFFVSE